MSYWHGIMAELKDLKYPEQIAYLRENFGFSQTHANALVMYSRGSKSPKRFSTLAEYLAPHDAQKQKTVKAILKAMTSKHPELEVVMAWNQPMLKHPEGYVFGLSVAKEHILIAPWGDGVIAQFAKRLTAYEVNKKTIKVPVDWKIDAKLLNDLIAPRLSELEG